MTKEKLFAHIDINRASYTTLSDAIFDNPEQGNCERFASSEIVNTLKKHGFAVELAPLGIETAFIARWDNCGGGYNVGLLCEYDALPMGHACGHHMQSAAVIGAALALKESVLKDSAGENKFTLTIYGTPAEETTSAKLPMAAAGYFDNLDVALMMHGSDRTTVDDKSLALNLIDVTFTGTEAHAAVAPEKGRSALDALIQFFTGVEFMREHMRADARIHGIIKEGGVAANIVPGKAVGQFYVRAADRGYLDELVKRFEKVAAGAAMMTETAVTLSEVKRYDNKVSVPTLNRLLLENAELAGAKDITPPRASTGSTDFSTVTYRVPGACIRAGFLPLGTSSHSQLWLDYGKGAQAHEAIIIAAKSIAGAVFDLVTNVQLQQQLKAEFAAAKK